jgi:bacterial/archaeal transporter family-2 protein
MLETLLVMVIGALGGIAVGIQTPIANNIGRRVGPISSSLIVHLSGAIISTLALVIRGGEQFREIRSVPWWMLIGSGSLGLVLITTINHTIPRIGATAAIALIICGQLITGMLIDHFGLLGVAVRPIEPTRFLAVSFLLIGGYLMVK